MAVPNRRPPDDPSSAPESGTVRDDTSGNLPAAPQERPGPLPAGSPHGDPAEGARTQHDDPSFAGEER